MISFIFPTYNEAANIETFVGKVQQVLNKNNIDSEILIVDDNSPDGTGKIADQLASKYPNLRVLHREKKEGLGKAYAAGLENTSGDLICMMDTDMSHNPDDIPRLLAKINEGYDLVMGSRYAKGGKVVGKPKYKMFISRAANKMANLFLGIPLADTTNSFRLFRRKILTKFPESAGNAFLTELVVGAKRKGCKITEVPITFSERKKGKSKLNFRREITRYLVMMFRVWFKR